MNSVQGKNEPLYENMSYLKNINLGLLDAFLIRTSN